MPPAARRGSSISTTSSGRRSPEPGRGRRLRRSRGAPDPDRARAIRLLILDVDGVLTDGRLFYGPDGEERQAFHVRDGLALARARAAGLPVAVLTSRTSAATAHRMAELGIGEIRQGVGEKVEVYRVLRDRYGCRDAEVAYVGDDLPDLPVLRAVGLAIAPRDAVPEVRRAAHWVTRQGGGQGAVREVIETLLRARGCWP